MYQWMGGGRMDGWMNAGAAQPYCFVSKHRRRVVRCVTEHMLIYGWGMETQALHLG